MTRSRSTPLAPRARAIRRRTRDSTPSPLWVADMSFPVAPSITRAIQDRLQYPTFGYFKPSEAYYQAIVDWHRDRKGVVDLEPRHIGYENGVLGGVVSTLHAFAAPGDPVLVHSPTYVGFTHCLEDNGFRIVHSPLVRDEAGVWRMDYEDMERRLADGRIHVAIFCSPHNPCGRVWERWEIERAMELYAATTAWSSPTRSGPTSCARVSRTSPTHVGLRGRAPAHDRPLRSVQDLQPRRPHRQLSRDLRRLPARPRDHQGARRRTTTA